MAGRIILGFANPALDADGRVAASTTLTFYQNLTTTLQAIYTGADLLTPLLNPLTCDAAGRFPMIWAPAASTYSVKLTIPGETPITYDNIYVTSANSITSSTRQTASSGTNATYTTPANVRQLRIRLKGSGGGGAGSSNGGFNSGLNGTDTVFNAIHASGGIGATTNSGTPPPGPGTGTASVRITGAPGQGARFGIVGNTYYFSGGNGGGNGGGADGFGLAGLNGTANTGGGGAGGGFTGTTTFSSLNNLVWTSGGSEGEYVEMIINNPAAGATYIYTVGQGGAGGVAGASGTAGGNGGSGYIIVDEYY